jgi:hypothetical protein
MENTNTQTKTFDFYKDEKRTIWTRAKFQIEAETYEQAVKMVKEMEENNEWDIVDIRYEDMPETVEIYSEDTNELILDNDPRIPQTK